MQWVHSIIASGDISGAMQVLQPFQNVIPMDESSDHGYKWKLQTVGKKHQCKIEIPQPYVITREREVEMWKASHAELKQIEKEINHEICCFPPSAKSFIAASLTMTPKHSGTGAEILAHRIACSILEILQLPYTEENILDIMPCKKTMEEWVEDLAVHQM
jgi:hypothetical protein